VPELQKLSGSIDVKETGKPKRQASKKVSGDDDTDKQTDGEEGDKVVKSKKGTKTGAKGRKPARKKKSEESDEDNDSDAGKDCDTDKVEKKNPGNVTNRKQVGEEKLSKKRVPSNQTGRSSKRKAK